MNPSGSAKMKLEDTLPSIKIETFSNKKLNKTTTKHVIKRKWINLLPSFAATGVSPDFDEPELAAPLQGIRITANISCVNGFIAKHCEF